MKHIRIAIIIMVILAAASVGLYFTANHFNNKNKEKSEKEAAELVIFDFDYESSTNLKIHNESGEYEMKYSQSDGWEMVSDVDFEVNSNTAIIICSTMSTLTAQKIINDSDKSKFGFDDSINLTVTENGVEHTLYVGDTTPTNESFYVMKEGSDNIYLIDYTKGLILCATKDSLKSTYIADFFSSEVDHFALWKGSENDDNVVFYMNKNSDGTWLMEKPYKDDSVYASDINTFLSDAIRDEIYQFITEDCPESDYSKYGFDDPQYVFEISSNGKNIKVIFGDYTNNDTEMYGLFTETGQVVTFYKNTVAVLGYGTADMMNKYVYSKPLDEINSVTVEMPDNKAELEADSNNSIYKINGKEVGTEGSLYDAYLAFFKAFNDAKFESVDKNAKPSGDAEVTVKYKLLDDTEMTIEYVPVLSDDSNTYYVIKNGEYTGFIMRKKVVANIISSYETLLSVK